MERKIIVTGDNSKTLLIPELDETYHSVHGALNEARHVFINNGFESIDKSNVAVFELGFGTGLNLLVTLEFLSKKDIKVDYTSIEKYPLPHETIEKMDYDRLIDAKYAEVYIKAHQVEWNKKIGLTEKLNLTKVDADVSIYEMEKEQYDIIYFDAFGPRVQPELWSVPVLKKMFESLHAPGRLVTYCAQGQFKRNLKAAGFEVLNVPGPPGKREMTIGLKTH
ncbi:MAG: tRNA (5-methylaminomethyl-2-thiouridine)(34)-methyltransferase MnmD [Crocinitomicaceae bacterium]